MNAAGVLPDCEACDARRRRMMTGVTATVGGIGIAAATYPFIASMAPSERALAEGGPVEADFSGLAAGQLMTVAWRGKPVWIMKRSAAMVTALMAPDPGLADPQSKRSDQPAACSNPTRSQRPDLFVAVGICTHLGCSPQLHLDDAALNAELHAPGGFICPCHGSRFDLAGRVVKDVPAPTNLEIPEYRFLAPERLLIGGSA